MKPITVWSDVGCPWASLAMHTLHRAASAKGQQLSLDHRAFPLELLNREPTSKPGHDEEVEAITHVVPDLGWTPWAAPDWTYPVTTLPVMEAVQAAKAQSFEASTELDQALRTAFFADHKPVSIHPVIEEIAGRCTGVDADQLMDALSRGEGRQQVYRDLEDAQQGDIQGSPHFWIDGEPFAANPGVDDAKNFQEYDASWTDELLDRA